MFMLGAAGDAFGSKDQEEIRKSISQSMREQGLQSADEENIQVAETHQREFTIRGKPATFTFKTGHNTETDEDVIEVTGSFEGKLGPAVFMMIADPEEYPEEEIVKIIESLDGK
jgi:hypothetical protein